MSPLPQISNKSVVITGVAGIGGSFSDLCLKQGAKQVFAIDRDQKALDKLMSSPALTKINADIGTKAGIDAVAKTIGSTPVDFILLAAACPKQTDAYGARLTNISFEDFDDMMRTDVHGKLFLVQALQDNLATASKLNSGNGTKARVLTLGAPFADGPKPDGSYAVVPGWAGFGAAKAGCTWLHHGMKMEFSEHAAFGYGHPGFTDSSLTRGVTNYDPSHPLYKMATGRFEKFDAYSPQESAQMFFALMTQSSDEEFMKQTWGIQKLHESYGSKLGVRATSDVAGGIVIPQK